VSDPVEESPPPAPADTPIVDLSALAFLIGLLVLAVAMMLLAHH